MADPEAEAREIVERLPVLTVPCSHCPKVSQHVVSDMARAANRAIDVIATALRAAREAERADVVELVKRYKGGERECDVCGCWNLVTSILDDLAHGDHVAARPAAPPEECQCPEGWYGPHKYPCPKVDDSNIGVGGLAVETGLYKARPDDAAVERVARAIYDAAAFEPNDEHFAYTHSHWLGVARAALAALRRTSA